MISNQPSYAPPSSDFANVPIYPPNNPAYLSGYPPSGYDNSQGNIYVNPSSAYYITISIRTIRELILYIIFLEILFSFI